MRQETGTEKAKRPIRILHITFNMGFGGTEQVIRQLVTNLPADEFSNQVLCIDGHVGEIGQQIAEQGIRVFALKRTPGFDWQLAQKIRKEIREQSIDIVHCHQYTPWVYGWLAHIGTLAKVVFTEHGRFYPDHYRIKGILFNPLMAMTSHAVIAISQATRSALSQYEFVPKGKVKVIYNGVLEQKDDKKASLRIKKKLGIPSQDFILGTVARLDPVKNQGMMLEAFSKVLIEHPRTWLMIIGDGPSRIDLEDKAERLGISHRVTFTGFRKNPQLYLSCLDLFLLTSHTEGTSMTLLEAMSMGIPAIVTSVGGNPEIVIDEKNGYLVPTCRADLFTISILSFINKRQTEKNKMSRVAKKLFSERFDVSVMLENYQYCYFSMVKARDLSSRRQENQFL